MNGSIPIGASLTATEDARSWLSPSGDVAFAFQRILGKHNYVLSICDPQGTYIWISSLISNLPYAFMNDTAYYISGTNDPSNWTNSDDALPSGDYYHRATLGFDGVFIQFYHPKNSVGNTSWSVSWLVPENICHNNVCSLNGASWPNCECLLGFPLLDPGDPHGDCKLNFTPSCNEDEQYYTGDVDFMELTGVAWPGTGTAYVQMDPVSMRECKDSCLHDCLCAAAVHNGDQYWKKRFPISNGWTNESLGTTKTFLKFRKRELPRVSFPLYPGKKKNQKTLITIISALLGCPVFVNVIFIGVVCLVEATNEFKEELGKGAFGIVYKGVIGPNIMAVKKLDKVFKDGEKEFHTEVNAIARTHHKNLQQRMPDHGFHLLEMLPLRSNEFGANITMCYPYGNFEIFYSDSKKIWESFSFPADTMLPTQIMKRGGATQAGAFHVEATNEFKEELGKGAFGIVYKGVIGANIMAVKKLDKVFKDGEKEFHTEVNAIARTHHKNLTRDPVGNKGGTWRLGLQRTMTLTIYGNEDIYVKWFLKFYALKVALRFHDQPQLLDDFTGF
nr:G-type lectin S-receptor-like serine/threonine-protein kinase LECRK3 [Tanacetum cinerariifolium]